MSDKPKTLEEMAEEYEKGEDFMTDLDLVAFGRRVAKECAKLAYEGTEFPPPTERLTGEYIAFEIERRYGPWEKTDG